ncbi:hypothetical protein [Nocardia sp. CNY236]|uniref:hypothetical protein n=1 Tax=Nocardia sp. CNY236 TaxID=1169152 RepID=UPI0003F97AFE|nr:hypothetical protein [Nocardia sp. CNY236]
MPAPETHSPHEVPERSFTPEATKTGPIPRANFDAAWWNAHPLGIDALRHRFGEDPELINGQV